MNNRYKIIICLIIIIIYYYKKKQNKNLPRLGSKPDQKKRTYDEFVEVAQMFNYDIPVSIKWIKIPCMEEFLPTYLKYKESLLLPIKNQGACAACWSYSVVQMIADRISVYTGGKIKRALSAQEMISCWDDSIREDTGCKIGGIPELAYEYVIKNGVALEKDYEYVQENTTSIVKCDKNKMRKERVYIEPGSNRSLCRNPEKFKLIRSKYNSIISENILNMKKEIFTNGEIVGTIFVYQNLYDYDGLSIYKKTSGEYIGGHAVIIIGWSDKGINTSEPGFDDSYWICKNFWSTEWPHKSPSSKGYFYIKMGENVAGIESRASRAFPVITPEIRSKMVDSIRSSRYESINEYVNDPERDNYINSVGKMKK